jgi:hypothetical protein
MSQIQGCILPADNASKPGRKHRPRSYNTTRKPTARARLTNGTALFLSKVDGRSVEARVFADKLAEYITDFGGREQMSQGEYDAARECAYLYTKLEIMKRDDELGTKPLNLNIYGMTVSRVERIKRELYRGFKRRMRDITPEQRHQELVDAGLA